MRFVILAHSVSGQTHWDLLLEVPGRERLRTIQMQRWALDVGASAESRELAPHRRIYLEYEGEISAGRGRVERIDEGHYETTDTGVRLISTHGGETELGIHDGRVKRMA